MTSTAQSLFAPLKKIKLSFFITPKAPSLSQAKLIACRNDSALFSRLFIACQIRNSDLDDFFAHENQVYPPALSVAGNLHFGNKADLLSCLDAVHPAVEDVPVADAVVIDSSALVNMLNPGSSKTFLDYANNVFMPSILVQLSKVHRVDVVRDLYDSLGINGEARAKRGYGAPQQVSASAPVPRKCQDFLRHENKTDLFCFLAEHICNKPLACGKLLLATHGRSVMCSDPDYNTSHLQPCGQEEADTRMLLHVADMVNAGFTKVIVRTVDTDVVVLAVAFCQDLGCDQLWLAFGTGKHFRSQHTL